MLYLNLAFQRPQMAGFTANGFCFLLFVISDFYYFLPSSSASALSILSMDICVSLSVLLILVSHMFLVVLCTETLTPSLYQWNFIFPEPLARQASVSKRPSTTGLSSWLNNFMECNAKIENKNLVFSANN